MRFLITLLLLVSIRTTAQHQIEPVHFVDGLCIKMPMKKFFKLHPKANIKKQSTREYHEDYSEEGYEVYKGSQVSYFFWAINDTIAGFKVLSPKISVGGFHPGMTLMDVLKKYPKLKIHIDEIAEYEYAHIDKQGIRLIFLTNNSNRVGRYLKKDWEVGSIGLNRPTAKVDRIDFY